MRTDNLIINGYGSSNGGEFHKVQLNGKCKSKQFENCRKRYDRWKCHW